MLGRIAIHLNEDPHCTRRIEAALLLAKQHKAEVVGVYPQGGYLQQGYYQNVVPKEIQDTLRAQHIQTREAVRQAFLDKAAATGVKAHWRSPRGEVEEVLALHARYADVLVMSKAEPVDPVTAIIPQLPETVVMSAGRPILMIPNAGPIETIGQQVLYCWDQRRESARAFTDAAPLLQTSKALTVLEVDRDAASLQERDVHENDFSDYCLSKGYPAPRMLVRDSDQIGVGNTILNTATDVGADLIVMGAYGHSRMRQWVMGGASRTLLSTLTVPVLLAH